MTKRICPSCGHESDGRFCPRCGGALGGVHCTQCGAEAPEGARFCTSCGATLGSAGGSTVAAGASGGGSGGATRDDGSGMARGTGGQRSVVGWWVAGAVALAAILAVTIPMVRENAETTPPVPAGGAAAGAPGAGPGGVDLSSMTPREAADQLFNRVMRSAAAGDTAQVMQFLPMATQAYDMARPLDADGLFHLALIHQLGNANQEALAVAEEALTVFPTHLLNLAAAARSADALGDEATARAYYQRLLDAWDQEMAKDLPEYEAHASMMPDLRDEAEAYLDG